MGNSVEVDALALQPVRLVGEGGRQGPSRTPGEGAAHAAAQRCPPLVETLSPLPEGEAVRRVMGEGHAEGRIGAGPVNGQSRRHAVPEARAHARLGEGFAEGGARGGVQRRFGAVCGLGNGKLGFRRQRGTGSGKRQNGGGRQRRIDVARLDAADFAVHVGKDDIGAVRLDRTGIGSLGDRGKGGSHQR